MTEPSWAEVIGLDLSEAEGVVLLAQFRTIASEIAKLRALARLLSDRRRSARSATRRPTPGAAA